MVTKQRLIMVSARPARQGQVTASGTFLDGYDITSNTNTVENLERVFEVISTSSAHEQAAFELTGASLQRCVMMATPQSFTSELDLESQPHAVQDHIPLGCLCLFPNRGYPGANRIEWTPVEGATALKSLLPAELGFVVRLFIAQWVHLYRSSTSDSICLRVYLMPDDIRQSTLDRQSKSLRADLGQLCSRLDTSFEAWSGNPKIGTNSKFDLWATGVDRSLFWLFNSLPSPSTDVEHIIDRYSRLAAETVLATFDQVSRESDEVAEKDDQGNLIPDLKATLYRYQARTVAAMVKRETVPSTNLDPRFEARKGPTGARYYYNARDLLFRLSQPQYEGNKGGILAEGMGHGKTVIIIALILATRFHLPNIPPEYSVSQQTRSTVGRLSEMAIAKAGKAGVPLKAHLHTHRRGVFPHLEAQINATPIYYEIPYHMRRSNRKNSLVPPPRRLRLCSTSIIVVPRNLLRQWQAELNKHADISPSGLRVLVLEKAKDNLPAADEIATYDILLFSKSRFEQEAKDGMDDKGRSTSNVRAGCQCPYIGATRIRDCTCLRSDEIYHTPLKELHFLRIIIDEGHEFSSSTSNAVKVATTLVTAERRWIVSGTPAKERLFGVDVELTSGSLEPEATAGVGSATNGNVGRFSNALQDRKSFIRNEELHGASKSLGVLLGNFLRVRPWAGTEQESKVEWEDFAFRHETFKGRTHTAFSQCMLSTLEALVLKTKPEDVERDVVLPPLRVSHKMLKPSYYDIITLNLFNFFITANAVTSERTDVDYLFHKNSTASRHSLVRNLRASPFFWTGWAESDVLAAIGHAERYMAKEGTLCSLEDRKKLTECVDFAKRVLQSQGWKAMAQTHELGVFVQQWPDEHRKAWSLDGGEDLMMVGASQLHAAQKFVNGHLFDENPIENLAALGHTERDRAFTVEDKEEKTKAKEASATKMGVPASGLREKQFDSRAHASPKKASASKTPPVTKEKDTVSSAAPTSPIKRKRSNVLDTRDLPKYSPLASTSIIGTVSSKLTYLLNRVTELYTTEKILIFYDADNAAWYISQLLDLLHIKHLIYARHLNVEQRSKYIVAFDTDDSIRVLLMDISHGAWGLNVNKASRVFFLNPPCAPHTEAQAIKRAHRIGQVRPVFVETLVLEGTIEEAIFWRSRNMTRQEHDLAGKEISNDEGIATVIQDALSIPLPESDSSIERMAPLETPLQVFGRKGRHDVKIKDIDRDVDTEKPDAKPRPQKKVKKVAFAGVETNSSRSASAAPTPTPVLNVGSIFG